MMYVLGFIHVRMDFEIIGKDILMECEFFLISFWIVIKMKLKLCWLHNYLVDLINSNKYTLSQSLLVKCFRIHVLRQTKELCIFHIFDAWKFHIFDDETMLFFFFMTWYPKPRKDPTSTNDRPPELNRGTRRGKPCLFPCAPGTCQHSTNLQ